MIQESNRRNFLKGLAAGAALVGAGAATQAKAADKLGHMQAWSCGGLAEAMVPACREYRDVAGVEVAYTGARASALAKPLMAGTGHTDVFCGRGLELAQKLRKAGKMAYFKPLCFSSYVIVVPQGNPWKIQSIEDLAKPGIPVAMAPKASPPGGASVTKLIENAKLLEPIMANVLDKEATCVLRTVPLVTEGKAAGMIVERRITRFPLYAPLEVVEIPFKFFPKGPLTFTTGVMTNATDRKIADDYLNWLISPGGQDHFENAGFTPAFSPHGQELVELLGVKDVD